MCGVNIFSASKPSHFAQASLEARVDLILRIVRFILHIPINMLEDANSQYLVDGFLQDTAGDVVVYGRLSHKLCFDFAVEVHLECVEEWETVTSISQRSRTIVG